MAYEENVVLSTFEAGQDLSSDQFRLMAFASDGQIDPAGAGVRVVGVLAGKPENAGDSAAVQVAGKAMVKVGSAGVTIANTVSSDASGNAINSTSGDVIVGIALKTGSSGEIVPVLLQIGGGVAA